MSFDLERYLARIGLADGAVRPDAEGLAHLQLAQGRAIAFENMDPLTGTVPGLSGAALMAKLVDGGRGGYCFELNGLMGMAMEALGFEARPMLCRVRNGAPVGGARTHLAHAVTIGGVTLLADCGFGGGAPVLPIRLGSEAGQESRGERFRLRPDAATGETVLERFNGTDWFALYGFDFVPVTQADREAANVVCCHWEAAPFPRHLMMTLVTPEGRNTLFNRELKRIRGGSSEARTIASLEEFTQAMIGDFGLEPAPELFALVWEKIATG